jgi:hypothetical protein
MGFNIHILSVRNRSTNLAGHAALAASFNPPIESRLLSLGISAAIMAFPDRGIRKMSDWRIRHQDAEGRDAQLPNSAEKPL